MCANRANTGQKCALGAKILKRRRFRFRTKVSPLYRSTYWNAKALPTAAQPWLCKISITLSYVITVRASPFFVTA